MRALLVCLVALVGANGVDWQAVSDELRLRIEQADTRAVLRETIHRLRQTRFDALVLEGEIGLDIRLAGDSVLISWELRTGADRASGGVRLAFNQEIDPAVFAVLGDVRALAARPAK